MSLAARCDVQCTYAIRCLICVRESTLTWRVSLLHFTSLCHTVHSVHVVCLCDTILTYVTPTDAARQSTVLNIFVYFCTYVRTLVLRCVCNDITS